MTIQQEIHEQCRFTREVDWCDLLARADAWVQELGLDARERRERDSLQSSLYRVWHNLGSPTSRVHWPAGITLADVQIRDVYTRHPSGVPAAISPNEVAQIWWECRGCYVSVSEELELILQTQWLPLVGHLVEVWVDHHEHNAVVSLAHDVNCMPHLWLELNQSGIEKLKACDAARL